MRSLGIVLVNYASAGLIEQNLPPEVATDCAAQVVVVDNYSSAAERQRIARLCLRRGWTLLESPNRGFGAGMNLGVSEAIRLGAEQIVLLNPDAVASAAVLAELGRDVASRPDHLVCPKMLGPSGEPHFDGFLLDLGTGATRRGWLGDQAHSFGWLSAACLAISAQAWRRLGGFDESYFLYWEDVDLSWRAAEVGLSLDVRTDLVVTHDEGGSQNRPQRAKSNLYYRYNARNRLLFARKHLRGRQLRSWLTSTAAQTRQIWLRGGRRQLFTRPGGAVAAVRGALAGLALLTRRPRAHTSGGTVLFAHPTPDLYGSDRVLLESVSAFVDAGDQVIVSLPGDGALVGLLQARGAKVVIGASPVLRKAALKPAGFGRLVADAIGAIRPTLRTLRRYRPTVVIVNTLTIPLWLVLARLAGVRTVCHVHEGEQSVSKLVRRLLYAPLFAAELIVTNSKFSLGVIESTWPQLARRTVVVPNGVPGPPEPAAPPRTEIDEPVLLFCGRLSPRKGPQVVIEALARLHERGIDARLHLLGAVFDGYEWFEAELHDQVNALGLDEDVHFLGFDPQIWPHLADADLIVVPSTAEETFGNTAVEAMLAARPLVVSATSGLVEASAGFRAVRRVPPILPDALADAVADLLASWPEVREQVLADRLRAEQEYAPATYQRRFRQAISELARR